MYTQNMVYWFYNILKPKYSKYHRIEHYTPWNSTFVFLSFFLTFFVVVVIVAVVVVVVIIIVISIAVVVIVVF